MLLSYILSKKHFTLYFIYKSTQSKKKRTIIIIHPHEEAVKKANEIFEEIDFNNDGSINFSEFLTVNMKKEKICNEELLKQAFRVFDLDGNGYITIDELKETIPLEIQNNSQWIDIHSG